MSPMDPAASLSRGFPRSGLPGRRPKSETLHHCCAHRAAKYLALRVTIPSRKRSRESASAHSTKPMFREAFAKKRCLIPASGYYEWQDTPEGKQPYTETFFLPLHIVLRGAATNAFRPLKTSRDSADFTAYVPRGFLPPTPRSPNARDMEQFCTKCDSCLRSHRHRGCIPRFGR